MKNKNMRIRSSGDAIIVSGYIDIDYPPRPSIESKAGEADSHNYRDGDKVRPERELLDTSSFQDTRGH